MVKLSEPSPIIDRERIKKFGEVFTPEFYARKLAEMISEEQLSDPNLILIEPACGDGSILIELLRARVAALTAAQYSLTSAIGLSAGLTWGFDIQRDNVDLARAAAYRCLIKMHSPIEFDLSLAGSLSAAIEYQIRVGDGTRIRDPGLTFLSLSRDDQIRAAERKSSIIKRLLGGDPVPSWLAQIYLHEASAAVTALNGDPWTDRMIFQLIELWEDGVSAREIARRLGVTRAAVLNKARRQDLPLRDSPFNPGDDDMPWITFAGEALE